MELFQIIVSGGITVAAAGKLAAETSIVATTARSLLLERGIAVGGTILHVRPVSVFNGNIVNTVTVAAQFAISVHGSTMRGGIVDNSTLLGAFAPGEPGTDILVDGAAIGDAIAKGGR
jgi:hypothetical protein